MDYSALNPTVWAVFIGSCIIIWAAVKIFHLRYPDYPGGERCISTYNNNHKKEAV